MPPSSKHPFEMALSLNVLNHLGLNLYSNVPAVLAEAVANSWDADAENVWITLSPGEDRIEIADDGHGMTATEINSKYLYVGYSRRDNPKDAVTPKFKREVMGRKGIGKLSLFSIAERIEIHTVKGKEQNGFLMSLPDIQTQIKTGHGTYYPRPVPTSKVAIPKGTKIILADLKKRISHAEAFLRKRLARRFSIIGNEFNFAVHVNDSKITISDRDYFHKIQYLWHYGPNSEQYVSSSQNTTSTEKRKNKLPGVSHRISGWIGSVATSGNLRDGSDNLNKIVIMARGRLAQEDILEDFGEGGMFTKYLIGEIHADFLDLDNEPDTATSSRQKIIEDDPRYQALRSFVQGELKHIQNKWTELRNQEGTKKALEIPAIEKWFNSLSKPHKRHAQSLFGKINSLTLDSEEERKPLFKHGILAFESLKIKENLDALERISPQNLQEFSDIFGDLDDIEATLFHQIVSERVAIIKALQDKVGEDARERIIQEYLFDHLWLLDPHWERTTTTPLMETTVDKEFKKINAGLSREEKLARLDIKYKATSGKHIIIELKRANRTIETSQLLRQIDKYRKALKKVLRTAGKTHEPVEFVCIVGKELSDWENEDERNESVQILEKKNARVILYNELIESAFSMYRTFLAKREEAGRVLGLIQEIDRQITG